MQLRRDGQVQCRVRVVREAQRVHRRPHQVGRGEVQGEGGHDSEDDDVVKKQEGEERRLKEEAAQRVHRLPYRVGRGEALRGRGGGEE